MDNKITGAFILLVLFLSSCVNETLSSEVRGLIKKNYVIKLLIVYVIIFFTINFTADDGDMLYDHLIDSSLIFAIFILAIKSHAPVLLSVGSLIIINHIVNDHINYLERVKKNDDNYQFLSHLVTLSIISISILGFIYKTYTMQKGRNFSVINYLITNH